jgi:hypothetical protein
MKSIKDMNSFADCINCLTILENNTVQSYQASSKQTEMPLAEGVCELSLKRPKRA